MFKKTTEATEEKFNKDNNQNDFIVNRWEYIALWAWHRKIVLVNLITFTRNYFII